jgi:serine/threonine protein kinase
MTTVENNININIDLNWVVPSNIKPIIDRRGYYRYYIHITSKLSIENIYKKLCNSNIICNCGFNQHSVSADTIIDEYCTKKYIDINDLLSLNSIQDETEIYCHGIVLCNIVHYYKRYKKNLYIIKQLKINKTITSNHYMLSKNFKIVHGNNCYIIEKVISYNTHCIVYKCHESNNNIKLVMKISNADQAAITIIFNEIKIITELNENTDAHNRKLFPVLYDTFSIASYCWTRFNRHIVCVIPLYDIDLRDYMQSSKMTQDNILCIIYQLVEALMILHKLQYLHSDIKPENIMWKYSKSTNNDIVLIDYGLSKKIPVMHNNISGTYSFIAPEIIHSGTYNGAVDVWALGCTIYECVVGDSLFTENPTTNLELAKLLQNGNKIKHTINNLSDYTPFNKNLFINIINGCLKINVHKRLTLKEIMDLLSNSNVNELLLISINNKVNDDNKLQYIYNEHKLQDIIGYKNEHNTHKHYLDSEPFSDGFCSNQDSKQESIELISEAKSLVEDVALDKKQIDSNKPSKNYVIIVHLMMHFVFAQ